ncbi:hypothetical protein FRACYDRAFT_259368 [Fragilariopsis cylindrus CCMP1102]|uniref:Uncharacterized protein n=1 Tax=Fragilariopsis cylindrus CCMP1102 TaxID=635003 RepID=A0A1E7FZV8_9STRA|nr:hypothetical protein FRACYDRAFT_259368 [Fragilariopsis cylindrus CCMP1102]|eukprot:OEU23353.1 hypothetical protein FRACYDRAFT_259368 [Fragilariopsis cylindrus CCMP1102]
MGKFLKDSSGNLVAIEGGLVLERILDRKPRDCESCGFSKWVKKDKVFIIQGGTSGTNKSTSITATTTTTANDSNNDTNNNNNTSMSSSSTNEVLGGYAGGGSMEWICPECALNRGLPIEFYHKNFHAPGNAEARHKKSQSQATATAKKAKNSNNNNNSGGNNNNNTSGLNKLLDMTSSLCRF